MERMVHFSRISNKQAARIDFPKTVAMNVPMSITVLQEDICKLRRKLEKSKKPADIPSGDEILNEEINDYKVMLSQSWFE